MGKFFKWLLNSNLGDKIDSGMKSFAGWFENIDWKQTGLAATAIFGGIALLGGVRWAAIAAAFTGIATALDILSPVIKGLTGLMLRHKAATGLLLLGVWGAVKAFKAISLFQSIFGKNMATRLMNVEAGVVNVMGGMGGGGGAAAEAEAAAEGMGGKKIGFFKRLGRYAKAGASAGGKSGYRGTKSIWGRLLGGAK
jgi:hypothetical protein